MTVRFFSTILNGSKVGYSVAMDTEEIAELDLRGLICPLPVLRARKALMAMESGQLLRISCTDPAAASDFPAFCRSAAHELIETGREYGAQGLELWFLIRRGKMDRTKKN